MIVLVTGANGFLGSALVSSLLNNTDYHVRCLVRPGSQIDSMRKSVTDYLSRCDIMYGALNNYDTCLEIIKNVDIVFHLASAKSGAPAEMFQGSSVATKCLLEAIKNTRPNIKLVHCSSFSVYGVAELKKGEIVNENTPLEKSPEKRDTYSFSKWHQEQLVRKYQGTYGIPTVILRPGVIYGKGGTPIPPRVGLNLLGIFLFIGGNNIIPLTYIDNCAEAFVTVAMKAKFSGEVYNIVDDDLVTAKEYLSLYRKIVKQFRYISIPYPIMWILSFSCERYFIKSRGQLPEIFTRYKTACMWKAQQYSNEKLKQLGWIPRVPTNVGIKNYFKSLVNS